MSDSDENAEVIKKAVKACEDYQIMIDIAACSLYDLRESLLTNPTSQPSQQALRESEVSSWWSKSISSHLNISCANEARTPSDIIILFP